jgi:hypothetical protein
MQRTLSQELPSENISSEKGLSDSELQNFEALGFLGPFDLPESSMEPWNTERLSAIGSRIREQHPYVDRNQHLFSKSLVDLVTSDAILDKVKILLGTDNVLLWVAHVIERKPDAPGQNWHVDRINMLTRSLHVSVALTDMTAENGCLRAIPHSHLYRADLSAGKPLTGDTDVSFLADSVAPWHAPHSVADLEVKAGQFFFTWGGLWHAVGKNLTASSRFGCVARFGRTDIRLRSYGFDDERQGPPLPCLLVAGKDDYGLNNIQEYPRRDFLTDREYNPSPPPSPLLQRVKHRLIRDWK